MSFIFGNEAFVWLPTINLHRKRSEINDPGASASCLAPHTGALLQRPSVRRQPPSYRYRHYRSGTKIADRHPGGEGEALSPLLRRLRGLGRCALEAVPCCFDLGFTGPVAPRPSLGDGCRESGDVKPDGGAGRATDEAGAISGIRLRSYP